MVHCMNHARKVGGGCGCGEGGGERGGPKGDREARQGRKREIGKEGLERRYRTRKGGETKRKEDREEEKKKVMAEETTRGGAFAAAYPLRHNLPTCSHGSSDKYRLTSQLKTLKNIFKFKKNFRLTINFIFNINQ